eukprot:2470013-Lingulodinium_polyedra.AAC.1
MAQLIAVRRMENEGTEAFCRRKWRRTSRALQDITSWDVEVKRRIYAWAGHLARHAERRDMEGDLTQA